jgi:hypothetical protein
MPNQILEYIIQYTTIKITEQFSIRQWNFSCHSVWKYKNLIISLIQQICKKQYNRKYERLRPLNSELKDANQWCPDTKIIKVTNIKDTRLFSSITEGIL